MIELVNLNVGGISLVKTGDLVFREIDPLYNSFLNLAVPADPDFRVNILPRLDADRPLQGTRVFAAADVYEVFQREGGGRLAWKHPKWPREYLVQVETNQDCRSMVMHCHEDLVLERADRTILANPLRYPVDQLLLMLILARRQGAVIHSAGINFFDRTCLFPGISGAGKSTISRLCAGKRDMEILSDDRIIVKQDDDGFRAYGTPWSGEAGIAVNRSAPLAAVFFLKKGEENRITKLSPAEALKLLLPTVSIPWFDPAGRDGVLNFCDRLLSATPLYKLSFTTDGTVADFLAEFMIKAP